MKFRRTSSVERRASKLPSAWSLIKYSVRYFVMHWTILVPVVAIVTVPATLLTASQGASPDSSAIAYSSLANLVMYLTVIWTVDELSAGRPVGIRQAYYHGSAALIKFILVAIILTLELLPLVFGLEIYLIGTVGAGVSVSIAEKILLGIVALILALPSLFLVFRSMFSLFLVQDQDVAPIQAVRLSFRLVSGHTWAVAQRFIFLILLGIAFLALPALALAAKSNGSPPTLALIAVQVLASIILLPISIIYLYRLYRAL